MNVSIPPVADLSRDPCWFADAFDPQNRMVSFVHLDRARLSTAPFLDQRLDRSAAPQATVSLDALEDALPPPRLNFIWHTSFCCSTLIAHALDAPGKNLSLREPGITMTLASAKRAGWFDKQHLGDKLPSAVFRLLARRFAENEQVLVKPTNTVNTLIDDAARLTSGKMLFLYSDCREFLLSIAKKKLDGAIFARKLFAIFANDGDPIGKLPPQQLFEMSDLQIAALVWQMQIGHFRRAMTALGSRAASLDCASFLADPKGVLARLDNFFGLGLGSEHIEAVVNGPLLSRNAKNESESYSAEARRRDSDAIAEMIGPDLERVIQWSYQAAPDTPRGRPLANALDGD
jgi:hypothetical protein